MNGEQGTMGATRIHGEAEPLAHGGGASFLSDMDANQLRSTAQELAAHCAKFQGTSALTSIVQLVSTAALFMACCAAIFYGVAREWWPVLGLSPIAAGLMVRLFILQHDCGHGSFFRKRFANDLVGRAISVITLTPYDYWRQAHAIHHATSGNLDRRGIGDIDTLTVAEYRKLPLRKKLSYRAYRHPFVWLLLGAPYHFTIVQRIPFGQVLSFAKIWRSVLLLDLALILVYGALLLLLGWKTLLIGFLPISVMAAWIGGWLFFIQHQFEDAWWKKGEKWDFHSAAILGSSYYVMPRILQWFTGSIGIHHIHHLCNKIPNYRLQECLNASPMLQGMSRLTLGESIKCIRLALWDEKAGKLVGFGALKTA